jgi:hypothetical protein
MSWTTNPNTAAWFATRFASAEHDPAVYSLRVNPEHILHITNERAEEEVVVDVWKCGRMKQMSKIPESVKPTSKI